MQRLPFTLDATTPQSNARATTVVTLHGSIQTPVFMPVGTQATVKGMKVEELKAVGSQIILGNTYHLMLRPGAEVFKAFGGIHRFMSWDGPVLTDSGGFQIFSLPLERRISEEGASFRSYVDGQKILLSPEHSIAMQRAINSDIMMVLDECVPSTSSHGESARAMELTHRWALRSLKARGDSPQALFGIVQGACYEDLRKISADFLTAQDFDGFAIGGLAVGESKEEREHFTEITAQLLPADRPRYLMGVGMPIDLLEAVHRGVDLFDCIIPSALGQQGTAFTHQGILRLRRGVYKFDQSPLEVGCSCYTCTHYTRAYLHHLTKSSEGLGWHLLAQHNFYFYHQLMSQMRQNIIAGTFYEYYLEKKALINRKDSDLLDRSSRGSVINRSPKQDPLGGDSGLVLGRYGIRQRGQGDQGDQADKDKPWFVVDLQSGESMHPSLDPNLEAEGLYIKSSAVLNALATQPAGKELVIWDVGLGAGHNGMAALRFASRLPHFKFKIVSFENDLDSFRLALKHKDKFTHLLHESAIRLAKDGAWQHPAGHISWQLHLGDFLQKAQEAPTPDLVFYDPFSTKTNPELWSVGAFNSLFKLCGHHPTEVITYSSSTAIRAALLASGFYVGPVQGQGPQAEATVAMTPSLSQHLPSPNLLAKAWLDRWERSSAQVPPELGDLEALEFKQVIRNHRQFTGETPVSDSLS